MAFFVWIGDSMANVTIPDLTAASALDGEELMLVNQDGFTRKLDLGSLAPLFVESGYNADGSWVRYADGTQICWGYGGYGTTGTWTYPQPFTGMPEIQLSGSRSDGIPRSFAYDSDSTDAISVEWNASGDVGVRVFAIGRWF